MGLYRELEGLLVVSVEQAVAAPYCGLLLADAGARVVKIERPEGDFARAYDTSAAGESGIFAWLNRGKESICIDFNDTVDAALLRRLLERADILLSNLAPGAMAKRGLTGDNLRAHNPGLITCEITGYGSEGAAAQKKAYDFLVQAESGICAVTGTAAHPARVGVSITDLATGLTAFSAIMRALVQRGRTQTGIDLSISMFDVMADWMNMALLGHRYLGKAPERMGLTHALIAPYGAYATGDGHQILISIQSNREWMVFCDQVLAQPELGQDPRFRNNPDRVENRADMDQVIQSVFSQHDRHTLIAMLDKARVASAQLNTVADLSSHPFLRNCPIHFAGTTLEVADLPVCTDSPRAADVPALNQHGDIIRREFQS